MAGNSPEILFEKFEIDECYKKDLHSAVYLAQHIYLGKKIILKALNTETIPDDSITKRFKREAKILAKLDHPNIIKVLDFGTYQNFFYISFEYFESNVLRYYLDNNELTGNIPKELGNLSSLLILRLNDNELMGPIPIELKNLENLTDNESDLRYNHLYTSDDTLRTFLNSKQTGGDWESYQTPPFIRATPWIPPLLLDY